MYHGQAPCEMTSTDTIKLIDEYRNSSNKKKQMLEKKYGKRQMQSIEKYLTAEYLQVCITKYKRFNYMEINE